MGARAHKNKAEEKKYKATQILPTLSPQKPDERVF